jgi:hypothetical protein
MASRAKGKRSSSSHSFRVHVTLRSRGIHLNGKYEGEMKREYEGESNRRCGSQCALLSAAMCIVVDVHEMWQALAKSKSLIVIEAHLEVVAFCWDEESAHSSGLWPSTLMTLFCQLVVQVHHECVLACKSHAMCCIVPPQ